MTINKPFKTSLVFAVAAFATLLLSSCANPFAGSPTASQTLQATQSEPDMLVAQNGKLELTLTAAESMVSYQGSSRWAMTYNGKVVGPTLVIHAGDHLTINLVNNLKQATSLHTHGLHVSPDQDNPFLMVEPGQSLAYNYDIPKNQQAGTFWYHPHMHGLTAEQVASGLSGAIIVANQDDSALAQVATDRVLVINDPPLTNVNPWADASTSGNTDNTDNMGNMGNMGGMGDMSGMGSMSGMGNSSGVDMMTAMMGRTGPRILTNGLDGVELTHSAGKLERLHLVNATASSRLQFAYSGAKMLVLSAEGGRLPAPVVSTGFMLAPGERSEVILVPSTNGGVLTAQRLSSEMGGNATSTTAKIASIEASAGTNLSVLPKSFEANTTNLFAASTKVAKTQVISLIGHMNPTFNGKAFDPSVVNFTAKKGTVEEWVIKNTTPMYHPIHLHTWGMQVKGQVGWQDVVTVAPNSEQVIRIAFDDFAGTTVLHCHILDHEDGGMMAIIKVS